MGIKRGNVLLDMGSNSDKYILITGGSGFAGVNLADRLLSDGHAVMIFDNLSRSGVENNLAWLKQKHSERLKVVIDDVGNRNAVNSAVSEAHLVYHFAAQVAVTSSLTDPFHDFQVNAAGTLNVLEAIRHSSHRPPIIFTSTNKVYGDLEDVHLSKNSSRYFPEDDKIRNNGISEKRNLDFHSPYGCTKGVADQYVLDYARTFGLKSVVFRMSCIYGPHQYGNEDQGWVAHFLIQALNKRPITLYGDGKQVRDILFVDDLVAAFLLAKENIDTISGNAFNMGGGVHNTVSLLELIELIGEITGRPVDIQFEQWRPSDQKYYVSNFGKFTHATGWKPATGTSEGVARLASWLKENVINSPSKQQTRHSDKKIAKLEPVDK